ncbi:MAG: hypothetical protein EBS73_16350 [Betaproteobacteria bacterium]|nr:hypothetical protein [Betaproteobacteria bacterium]
MRWAIIKDNEVINVAVADEAYGVQMGWVPCPDFAGPGWGYVDGTFTKPLPVEITQPASLTKEDLMAQLQALQQQIAAL